MTMLRVLAMCALAAAAITKPMEPENEFLLFCMLTSENCLYPIRSIIARFSLHSRKVKK